MNEKEPIERRVSALERELHSIRTELRAEIKRAAHELRDDTDFAKPYWQSGADHITDRLFTQASRKVLWALLGAIASGLLLWAGKSGIFT